MKHLPLLLTIVLSASALAQKTTPSKITRVTLFAKNAQVERLAEAALSKGEQTILFSGLSPKVVQNSIRVRTNRKNVLIRQNAFKTEFTETDVNKSEIETLYKQLDAEKRKLELIDAQKAGLLKEREFLDQNTDINGARGMNMNLTQFQQTGDYFRKKMESVQAELYDLEVKRNKQKEAINAVTAQLKEKTSVRTDVVGVLAITVDAESAGPITFYIDYLVTDAGWQPEYELRVDDIGKPVRLELKARLAQQTNVEWKNVALSFSTGDPQRGSQVPELTTWYITQPVAPPPVYNSNPPTKQNLGYTGRFVGTVKNNETGEGIPSAVVAFISPQGEVMHTELAGYDGSYSFLNNESVSSIQFSAFGIESKTLNVHTSPQRCALRTHHTKG